MKTKLIVAFFLVKIVTFGQLLNENFDNVYALYVSSNWYSTNNSNPGNSCIWSNDYGNFTAHSGAPNASAIAGWYCTDTVGVGTTSVWLFTPPLYLQNGDSVSFWTISYANNSYPDRLELRLNSINSDTLVGTTETSLGNFTTLLLTINPLLDTVSYPLIWTKYNLVITGTIPHTSRLAFRYTVPNTGGLGVNGSVIGIDDFHYSSILLSVTDMNTESEFLIYPNPANSTLFINSNTPVFSIKFYDVNGNLVNTQTEKLNHAQISVSNLNSGMYFIELTTENGVFRKKWMKN